MNFLSFGTRLSIAHTGASLNAQHRTVRRLSSGLGMASTVRRLSGDKAVMSLDLASLKQKGLLARNTGVSLAAVAKAAVDDLQREQAEEEDERAKRERKERKKKRHKEREMSWYG